MNLRCMDCGKKFNVSEYIDEIDEKTWERIAGRSCDRA
ncbi:MAG: hypothetical protein VST72_09285 [Nitrospirota bacterium]|nr:hypothetical protein [Nitrospirota bacterium]